MQNRKRAPGNPQDHPDWVISLSGGVDSVAAALTAFDSIRTHYAEGNFVKKPIAIYLDTRVGVPLNRLYVEQFCDWLGIQLWTLRTHEKFEEWIQANGAPGGGKHGVIRDRLKGRQSSKLSTALPNPVYVLGLAADESDNRADMDKVERKDGHTEVYPVHRLTRKERAEIVLRSECPINPLWMEPEAIKDCGCLANGDPSELEKTEELFPQFGQRMREWEESINHDGIKDTLGWGSLSSEEAERRQKGLEQTSLTVCTDGCGRRRDPDEVAAFKVRAEGGTVDEAVSVLHGGDR